MSVYVDPLFEHGGSKSFRWKISCHMYADTLDELHAMALRIGMRRAWFQDKPKLPHYDLVPARRSLAVKLGAVEHTRREMVAFMSSRLQLGVLLGGELQPDGSASLGDGVLERGAIFEDVALSPALEDLDDLVGSGEGELAGERGAAILVEEADMPSLATHEVHQDAVLRGLPAAVHGLREVRHGGIVSELKAKMSTGPQVSEKAGLR